jgi:hypothetical protein
MQMTTVSEWITTDGQSVSLSWCQAPRGAHDQILINIWLLLFFFPMLGTPSDERSGLSFVLVTWTASVQFSKSAAGPRQHSIYLSVFITPGERVAQLYPQARVPRGCHSPYPLLWAPEGQMTTVSITVIYSVPVFIISSLSFLCIFELKYRVRRRERQQLHEWLWCIFYSLC